MSSEQITEIRTAFDNFVDQLEKLEKHLAELHRANEEWAQLAGQMLRHAQVIRINQVQMAGEIKGKKAWPVEALQRCDDAWDELNRLDREMQESAVTRDCSSGWRNW